MIENYISPELKEENENEVRHAKEVMVVNGYPKVYVGRWSKVGLENPSELMKRRTWLLFCCMWKV